MNETRSILNSTRHKEVEYLHDFSLPFEDQVMWYQWGLLAAAAQRCFSANEGANVNKNVTNPISREM